MRPRPLLLVPGSEIDGRPEKVENIELEKLEKTHEIKERYYLLFLVHPGLHLLVLLSSASSPAGPWS